MEQMTPASALAAMTEHAARLRSLLERYDRAALATRPSAGEWSAVENVRHAFYAEQDHLGRYLPGGLGLSPLGLPQGRHPAVTGPDPRTDLSLILFEWERVHKAACDQLDLSLPGLAIQLPRLMRHQQAHGRLAARALSQVTGQPVRIPRAQP